MRTHFSNTTPNTSSTSPASPRPVIRARQVAAARKCSAATTISHSSPWKASSLNPSRWSVQEERSWLCRSETPRRSRSFPTFVIIPNVVCRMSRRLPIFPSLFSASWQDMGITGEDLPGNRLSSCDSVHSRRLPRSRVESHLLMTTIAWLASAAILRLSRSPGTISINVLQFSRHSVGRNLNVLKSLQIFGLGNSQCPATGETLIKNVLTEGWQSWISWRELVDWRVCCGWGLNGCKNYYLDKSQLSGRPKYHDSWDNRKEELEMYQQLK